MQPKVCTFDVESNGLLPEADTIWCAVIKDHATGERRSYSPDWGADYVTAFLKDLDTYDVAVGHNCIGFDFPLLRNVVGYSYKGKQVDTLLMSRVQRPKRRVPPHCPTGVGPHSVGAWGFRLGRGKVDIEDWSVYTTEMLHRCEEDVEIQFLIYLALLEEGKGEGWTNAHKLNFNLFKLLQRQEEYGWLVDQDHMHNCIHMLGRWVARIDAALANHIPIILEVKETKKEGQYNHVKKPFKKDGTYSRSVVTWLAGHDGESTHVSGPFSRVSFRRLDLNSNREVKGFLLDLGWQPDQWNTNGEGERTSPKLNKDDPFHGLQSSLGRLVARRFQCRSRRSILEGLLSLVREDGRIGARVTGLAATYRAKHAGIVNIPSGDAFFGKWMRQCFIAKPGWVLVGVDSAGNQARQLAARMGDEEFTNAVLFGKSEEGTDFHTVNQKKTALPSRKLAKNFFYAFIFGVGNSKLARMLGNISVDAAKAVRERYLRELPGLKLLLERGIEEWQRTAIKGFNPLFHRMEYKDGWVKAIDGRPMQIESEHKILGYYLQSDEAIQMAAAYCVWHKWMEKAGYVHGVDYGTVCWYHDEWTFECDPRLAGHAMSLAEEAIAWAGRYYNMGVPHEGQGKIGKNWYEIH